MVCSFQAGPSRLIWGSSFPEEKKFICYDGIACVCSGRGQGQRDRPLALPEAFKWFSLRAVTGLGELIFSLVFRRLLGEGENRCFSSAKKIKKVKIATTIVVMKCVDSITQNLREICYLSLCHWLGACIPHVEINS